jgi:O-antigen ligase
MSDRAIVAGLNAGSIIGLLVIAAAGARLLLNRSAYGLLIPTAVLITLGFWFGVGVLQYGLDASFIRELVRATSIVAVAFLAANALTSPRVEHIAATIVLAAVIPALLVLSDGVMNWQAMVAGELRPRGTLSHPNAAAILFGVALPVATWGALHARARLLWVAAGAILLVAIVFTQSLGGLMQAIAALLAFAALTPGVRSSYRVALGALVVLVVAGFIFDPLGISRVSEVDATVVSGEASIEESSFAWRLYNWGLLLNEWRTSPLGGHGLGATFDLVMPIGHLPHSDPVRVLVEMGIGGAALVLVGYGLLVNRLVLLMRRGPNRTFVAATFAALIGFTVHGLATHATYNTQPMYVLAALLGWTLAMQPLSVVAPEQAQRSEVQDGATSA